MSAAGKLRERVTIEQVATSRDAVGGTVETWSQLAQVWARVEPMSVRESYQRHVMNAQASWKVTIRHRSDVTAKMRVRWGARMFEIKGITNADERRFMLALSCEEIAVR